MLYLVLLARQMDFTMMQETCLALRRPNDGPSLPATPGLGPGLAWTRYQVTTTRGIAHSTMPVPAHDAMPVYHSVRRTVLHEYPPVGGITMMLTRSEALGQICSEESTAVKGP